MGGAVHVNVECQQRIDTRAHGPDHGGAVDHRCRALGSREACIAIPHVEAQPVDAADPHPLFVPSIIGEPHGTAARKGRLGDVLGHHAATAGDEQNQPAHVSSSVEVIAPSPVGWTMLRTSSSSQPVFISSCGMVGGVMTMSPSTSGLVLSPQRTVPVPRRIAQSSALPVWTCSATVSPTATR